jgi:REP element-mobilizing transposase RayT
MRQLGFSFLKDYKKEFGGELLLGKRKSKRPLSTKHPMHLVLRSDLRSVFRPTNISLHNLIQKLAKEYQIKIYDYALNWSHIHLVIRMKQKGDYVKFIRALTSILAQRIRKTHSHIDKVFTLRPFTRILTWGKDFRTALQYQVLNKLESHGLIKRSGIKKRAKSKAPDCKPKA